MQIFNSIFLTVCENGKIYKRVNILCTDNGLKEGRLQEMVEESRRGHASAIDFAYGGRASVTARRRDDAERKVTSSYSVNGRIVVNE